VNDILKDDNKAESDTEDEPVEGNLVVSSHV